MKILKTLNQNKSIKSIDRWSYKIEYGQKILKTKLKVWIKYKWENKKWKNQVLKVKLIHGWIFTYA